MSQPIRVLVAKPGLDGHDRGALVVAQGLRDEGMEVIYTGLRQTPAQIVATAIEEDVLCVGLSSLSGAHMTLFPEVVRGLREQGADDILVIGGGVIPEADIVELKAQGVAEVFTPGSSIRDMADYIRAYAHKGDSTSASQSVLGLDHVGIAVENLDDAITLYASSFGLHVESTETVEDQGLRVAFLTAGESHIELLEPTSADSPVGKFLATRGPGIHHLAYRVKDIHGALESAKRAGLRLIDEAPRRGAGGKWVAFIHPKAVGGVLTEYCQSMEKEERVDA